MERPRPQELYRHFKGNLYQVVTIATHSETMEEMVVYQALYGDYKCYVRPLDMFMSKVDKTKYPSATQEYRFEKVTLPAAPKPVVPPSTSPNVVKPEKFAFTEKSSETDAQEKRNEFRRHPYNESQVMAKSVSQEAEDLNMDPLVIQFLDADLASEKNAILSKLRPTITNDMIDIMAMSMGVVVNEGDVYDRFNDLRTCLTTIEKFESNRLRS